LRDAGQTVDPSVITYLNRLADLLWLLGRLIERDCGVDSSLRGPEDAAGPWSKAWP
jgi:cob(I)alamin adenosyltransferase